MVRFFFNLMMMMLSELKVAKNELMKPDRKKLLVDLILNARKKVNRDRKRLLGKVTLIVSIFWIVTC